MTYQPGTAFQPLTRINRLQHKKLRELLVYLNNNSAYYHELFTKHNIDINSIRTIADLKIIPPTEKEHIQSENNRFLCVPKTIIIEYTSTSGTLGSPVTIALTENDLQRLA